MISTYLSIIFAVISILFAIINLLFIAQHADQYATYKACPNIQTERAKDRYWSFASGIGLIVLFFIGLSFLADFKTAKRMSLIFGGYKIFIPLTVWVISYMTPGKKIWIFKRKA